ncbi:MAG: glycosyltransferase family 4 protein [Bacteroides sp.]|jgi:glycosyltransferase involved in cell wall biosynthesis|nr:glycosyltransferase family 4 protein [Bacteroides sp.]
MSKNILLLTPIFPADDLPITYTKVIYYFAKEWREIGYTVKIVHCLSIYPRCYYFIASLANNLISSLTSTTIPMRRLDKVLEYNYQGLDVLRIPIFKVIPHTRFKKKRIEEVWKLLNCYLKKCDFEPDIVMGHWANPQLELLSLFKYHCGLKTSLVLHESIGLVKKLYREDFEQLISSIDFLFFRSLAILNDCIRRYQLPSKLFLCQSGIPEELIIMSGKRAYTGINSFIFVGMLIHRKYPDLLIRVIPDLYAKEPFTIKYIGEGRLKKKMFSVVKRQENTDKIFFLGQLARADVYKILKKSDCLIMISKNEVFGLIYLEAMSAGCIVVAARGEGADGIIVDGKNGFLCEAGNEKELRKVILNIKRLTNKEIEQISDNAIETASHFTDKEMARKYLELVDIL